MTKFSIRDLLLVTVIVALAVGWWVDHRRQATRINSDAWKISGLEQLQFSRNKQIIDLKARLPNSQAPAPNPPKE